MGVFAGSIAKMKVGVNEQSTAQYQLPVGEHLINMNQLIGKTISMDYDGIINCVHCNRKTKKSFNQGYCFVCVRSLAQCDSCIIKPEKCHYHEGTCRDSSWGENHCLQSHYVYLANTGQIKVGITRHVSDDVSSRWIDQGATQALPILCVSERLLSGLLEIKISKFIGDKTNWRLMLKGEGENLDLVTKRDQLLEHVSEDIKALQAEYGIQAVQTLDSHVRKISYPVNTYPEKISSINLDREGKFTGTLVGIKGQYLLLDENRVINMRKYTGYKLRVSF